MKHFSQWYRNLFHINVFDSVINRSKGGRGHYGMIAGGWIIRTATPWNRIVRPDVLCEFAELLSFSSLFPILGALWNLELLMWSAVDQTCKRSLFSCWAFMLSPVNLQISYSYKWASVWDVCRDTWQPEPEPEHRWFFLIRVSSLPPLKKYTSKLIST